jgi:hypothetical protein
MTVKSTKFGPGSLNFSTPAPASDWSCQISKCKIVPDKDQDDDVIMLCGDVKPGATTYKATLEGTIDQDLEDPAGIVYWSWNNKGVVADVTFIPNDIAAHTFTGQVIIDPLDVGGDEGGKDMTSDFTYGFVGFPELGTPVVE